ncbi:unnamed protein product [Urochloa humidicola]
MSSEVVDELPSCIALQSKSNGKFLRYVHEHGERNYRQLQLNGEDPFNPFTRFDVEPSRLHPGLVHIRCRYNRKYWRAAAHRRGVDGDDDSGRWIIVADADEPEEDLSKPSCTVIKAVPVSSYDDASRGAEAGRVTTDADDGSPHEPVMTFRFIVAGRLLGAGGEDVDDGGARMLLSGTGSVGSCLCVGRRGGHGDDEQAGGDGDDGFIVFNLSNSRRMLPRRVAFKGSNGKYLTLRMIQGRAHLVLESDDIGDAGVANEIAYLLTNTGVFRVINLSMGGYWLRPNDTNRIQVGGNFGIAPLGDRFQAIEVGSSFALRMNLDGVFCVNQTALGTWMNCLEYSASSLRREALVQVEEAVMHREISDIVYNLDEARVYDPKVLSMAMTGAVNDTSTPNTKRLTISFEETETAQWDSTLEVTIGYTATMKVGFPKLGLGARAELSAEFFGSYNWGETVVTTVKKEVEYEVTVPPKTMVSVRLIATKASCDVPFSYRQRDTFTDGTVRISTKPGGIFTGVNSYNFHFQTTESPLEKRLTLAASSS